MEVTIKIMFALDYFPFITSWELPYLPSVGDTLELDDILSDEQLEETKNIKFKGHGKYDGLNINLYSVIYGNFDCKVFSIHWMKNRVELYIKNETYCQNPERWIYY